MKYLFILSGVVCLSFMLLPACAPQPEPEAAPEPVFDQAAEEAAIRAAVEQIYAAMKEHDAKAYAALCAENSENWEGDIKGRAAIGKTYADIFAAMKDIQFKLLDEIGIVFVTPDVAIYKHHDEITGSLDDDGNPVPPIKRLSAKVFVKKNDKWLFAAHFYRTIEE